MTPNQELVDEGTAREIINRVQKLKKKAQLIPTDPVIVYYHINKPDSDVKRVASTHKEFVQTAIKSPFLQQDETTDKKEVLIEEMQELKEVQLLLKICSTKERAMPVTPWINLVVSEGVETRYSGEKAKTASLNLKDFKVNLKLFI